MWSTSHAIPLPGQAADRLVARFPPFKNFSISVRDLETFAQDGKIPADYTTLLKQVPPAQLQQFRRLLQQRLELSPEYVKQFTRAPLVEELLEQIGESVQTASRQNGMKSLRSALISAAEDKKQGLTLTNVIRRFPGREVNLELAEVFTIYNNLTKLFKRRDITVAAIDSSDSLRLWVEWWRIRCVGDVAPLWSTVPAFAD
jgi:Alpha/beta hydrolase of unknown function (DUF1400)